MPRVGRMMLNSGKHGGERILSRLSVEPMTTDHISPEQKAASPFVPGFWDSRGWGFGLSIITRRDDVAAVPSYSDPPRVVLDFWTLAYQAIGD